jgi:hypothetical protein
MSVSSKPDSEANLSNTRAGSEPAGQPSEAWSAESLPPQSEAPEAEPSAESAPRKKRYYSPGEVMKKKGCIGCGGMVLAIGLAVVGIAAAFALL